jgi:prephenate dehydratase
MTSPLAVMPVDHWGRDMEQRVEEVARTVAYLGPSGTFTHEAAQAIWEDRAVLKPVATLPGVVDAVLAGEAGGGVIPIENTVEGVVSTSIDQLLFRTAALTIHREVSVRITFNAYRARNATADPSAVASHPHGLAQCREFVAATGLPTENHPSTAAAVEAAARRPGLIAIGAPGLDSVYDVELLSGGVEDHPSAYTRFIHIGSWSDAASLPPSPHEGMVWRTTLALTPVSSRPGILAEIFTHFADQGINVSALTSRPLPGFAGAYVFVVTVDNDDSMASLSRATSGLLLSGIRVKFLGNYLSDFRRHVPSDRALVAPPGSFGHHDATDFPRLFAVA